MWTALLIGKGTYVLIAVGVICIVLALVLRSKKG